MRKRDVSAGARYRSFFTTDLGVGGVVASNEGLVEVFLPFGGDKLEVVTEQISARYPSASEESLLTKEAAALLTRYFSGDLVSFHLPIDTQGFTVFQWAVYEAVMAIPPGEVRSYSLIAAEIGRPLAARGIGGAMARNPLPVIVPCHRIVGKTGKMTGYSASGGIASKQWLLNMEKMTAGKNRTKSG